jgi:hypothetical protein
MNMCDPDQPTRFAIPGFDPRVVGRESSVLIGDTSAAVHTLAGDCTSKASDIAPRPPRLSAACFVQKEEFLAR